VLTITGCEGKSGLLFQYNTKLSSAYRTEDTVLVELVIESFFVNKFNIEASDIETGFVKFILVPAVSDPIELT
jgi:hypothetical protein